MRSGFSLGAVMALAFSSSAMAGLPAIRQEPPRPEPAPRRKTRRRDVRASGSIATLPHKHERERSRRLRQAAQVELNRANRWLRDRRKPTIGFGDPLPEFGLTRSGRKVAL